jgi:hypothetical protein
MFNCSRVLLEKLIVVQLVHKFLPFMEFKNPLQCSQKSVTGYCLEPIGSSSHHHILYVEDQYSYYPPFQLIYSILFSQEKFCMPFSTLACMLMPRPSHPSFCHPTYDYVAKTASYGTPEHAVFSSNLSLPRRQFIHKLPVSASTSLRVRTQVLHSYKTTAEITILYFLNSIFFKTPVLWNVTPCSLLIYNVSENSAISLLPWRRR